MKTVDTALPITLTCADYARVMPLATGEVKPEGIALTMLLGSRGSWPARADMINRAVQDPKVQGGEWSMAQYLYRIDKGDRRYVGLLGVPAAELHRARSLRLAGADRSGGRRISPASASACTAERQRFPLVPPLPALRGAGSGGHTVVGRRHRYAVVRTADGRGQLPAGVHDAPAGRSLSDMLIAGEIEAIYSPPRPPALPS